jgi:hypothetical protein
MTLMIITSMPMDEENPGAEPVKPMVRKFLIGKP